MRNDKIWDWVFALFLLSIPVAFLGGSFLWVGLIYLLICILDIVDGYKRNIRRDLRGYITIILGLFISIIFCFVGAADMLLK